MTEYDFVNIYESLESKRSDFINSVSKKLRNLNKNQIIEIISSIILEYDPGINFYDALNLIEKRYDELR